MISQLSPGLYDYLKLFGDLSGCLAGIEDVAEPEVMGNREPGVDLPRPDSFDQDRNGGGIGAALAAHLHGRALSLAVAADGRGGAEALGHFKAIVVEIDHDDLRRRMELGGEQCRESDRSGANDRHSISRRDLSFQYATLKAGRWNVAEHRQRPFTRACGNRIETGAGVGKADGFGPRTIDGVAEDPAAGRAVGGHLSAAIFAFVAGVDAGLILDTSE
jgi:hypothetical protein